MELNISPIFYCLTFDFFEVYTLKKSKNYDNKLN